jgi:hypothetical protein
MTKIFRHPAKVGLLLVLLMGLLGTGQCEMAMQIWAGLCPVGCEPDTSICLPDIL